MGSNHTLSQFCKIIAKLSPDKQDCRRVCTDAGLDIEYINFDGPTIDVWNSAVYHAHHRRMLNNLVQEIQKQFGEVPETQNLNVLAREAQSSFQTLLRYSIAESDRVQLINILSGRAEFCEGVHARRMFLQLAGVDHLLAGLNLNGAPQTVARELVPRLENLPLLEDRPECYPLGKLLEHLILLPDLAKTQAQTCARLIVQYRLILTPGYIDWLSREYALEADFVPDAGRRQEHISRVLAERRRVPDPMVTLHTYDLDHDSILRDFDLDVQMGEITPRLRQYTRGGLAIFVGTGDRALVSEYMVPRIYYDVRSRLGYSLVRDDVYIHASESGEIEMRFSDPELGVGLRNHAISAIDDLLALASRDIVHRLIVVWNHELPSAQMEDFVRRFVTEGSPDLVTVLQRHSLLYVLVWISLQPASFTCHDTVCCLSPIERLDPDFVLRWVRLRLEDAGVQSSDVGRALDRLARKLGANQGVPQFVFHEIKEIIIDLNKGRI